MTSRLPCLLAFLCVIPAASGADLPTTLDVSALRGVVTQHDGRWPPLDTVARDFVHSVTGQKRFRDADPVLVLLGWTFEPAVWSQEPLISIRNAELRREIGLPADKAIFSFSELVGHARLRSLIDDLSRMESGRKPDPLQKKVSDIHEKLIQLQVIFGGQAIRLIPSPTDPLAAWNPIPESPGANPDELTAAWNALRAAYIARDEAAFTAASLQVAQASSSSPAAFRPPAKVTAAELRYNRLAPYATAWKLLLTGAVLAAVAAIVRRRAFDALAAVVILGGFGVLTYGLSLRWQIAGRIPASNMFESLLFLSWGMGAFAIVSVFLFRHRLVPLTAAGMSAVSLVLADKLPVDQFVRPIAPVLLDTVWMSIHVPIIMVSYSVLALAVLVAHLQLVTMALAPRKVTWAGTLDGLHYGYVHVGSILLTIGIITGSMWAASSWGRYWGWDPKEVWSLVALLGYMTILHVRIDHERVPAWGYAVGLLLLAATFGVVLSRLGPVTTMKTLTLTGALAAVIFMVLARGVFATAAKSILCFWLIIMTYVGVNFVLGIGLHSYGFGTGAVAKYMFYLGGADLAFVALCALVYLARRAWKPVARSPVGQAAIAREIRGRCRGLRAARRGR